MLKQYNKKYRHGPSTLPPCIMRRYYFLKDSFNTQSNSQKTHTHKKQKKQKQNQKTTKTMPIICIDGRTCQNEIKFKIYLLIFINFKHSLTGLKHIF